MVDFLSLKNAFKGDIVEPNSPDYPAAIARWAANTERKARYVMFPKDEDDVSLALKFATSNGIPLAIKCGGHNPSGASSIEDGLCIDLSRYLNTARVDTNQNVVHVGGGALWEAVDRATGAHGLGTTGGTVNHTGVAGLLLAGGYGWLSAEHGLVIDNLVQATVVTADGTVVTASTTSHPDLFWGIRGGGSNFGVVTEFVLKVYPQRKTVFAGPVIFPPTLISKVSEAVDMWWAGAGEKEGVQVGLSRGPGPDRQPVVTAILFFNGSEAEGRANFKWLYDLGPVADFAGEIPYERLNGLINERVTPGQNYYMSGTSLRSLLSAHAVQLFEHMVSVSATPNSQSTFPLLDVAVAYELFPLQKICAVPPDATAFRSRGPQPNVVLVISWDKQKDQSDGLQHARDSAKELVKIIESTEERQPKEDENEIYGNYVCEPSMMPVRMRQLWGDNYPRLQKVKKQYDPDVVFNRWFPIQPA